MGLTWIGVQQGKAFSALVLRMPKAEVPYTTKYEADTIYTPTSSPLSRQTGKRTTTSTTQSLGYHLRVSEDIFLAVAYERNREAIRSTGQATPSIPDLAFDDSATLTWSRLSYGGAVALDEHLRLGVQLQQSGEAVDKETELATGAGSGSTVAIGWQQANWSLELQIVNEAENKKAETQKESGINLVGEWLLAGGRHSLQADFSSSKADKLVVSGDDVLLNANTTTSVGVLWTRQLTRPDTYLYLGANGVITWSTPVRTTKLNWLSQQMGVSVLGGVTVGF